MSILLDIHICFFQNGRVEGFLLHHMTLAAADIHEKPVSQAIAATLARFHAELVGADTQAQQHRHFCRNCQSQHLSYIKWHVFHRIS